MRFRVLLVGLVALVWFVACSPPPGAGPPAPTLLSASPADGASDVALDEAVVLRFSGRVEELQLTPSPLVGLAAPVWDAAHEVVTVAPSPAWPAGAALTFAIDITGEGGGTRGLSLHFTTLNDQQPPSTPVGLTAEPLEAGIRLAWTANTDPDLARYLVFWGIDGTPPTGVAALPATVTEHVLTPLENGTPYAVYLVAEDHAGNRSAPSATVTVTPRDTTPPTITSSDPSDGLKGVGLVTRVRVVFSEPLEQSSLALALYRVQAPADGEPIDPNAPVAETLDTALLGAPIWSGGGSVLEYGDVAPTLFESDMAYRLELSAADLAGNALASSTSVTFMTGFVPDVTPPEVTGYGSSIVPDTGTGRLDFYFSEPMDQAATVAAFRSVPTLGCAWTWPTPAQARCTLASGLRQLTGYAVQFTTIASDLMGNFLLAPWNDDFTTPNFSPRLLSFTPALVGRPPMPPRTTNPYQPITWTFSEPVRLAGVVGDIRTLGGVVYDSIAVPRATLSADGLTITYTPTKAYSCQGATYAWQLTTVYEQGDAEHPTLSTPQSYSSSFQCGEPVVGSSSGPDAQGE